jgi:hypothetical protein
MAALRTQMGAAQQGFISIVRTCGLAAGASSCLSIVSLVLVARKANYPQALTKPYRKGER